MITRKEKIQFIKKVQTGKIGCTDAIPKLDLVILYPDLKKISYCFINGKMVDSKLFFEEQNKLEKQFGEHEYRNLCASGQCGTFYLGRSFTKEHIVPLPEFFKPYLKAEKAAKGEGWYEKHLKEQAELRLKYPSYDSH